MRPGRCQHHLGLILVVGPLEGGEGSQPEAWTTDPQSLEREVSKCTLRGREVVVLVVVASGSVSTLFSQ